MLISIQTKHCKLSQRLRQKVEAYIRGALRRNKRQISSVVLTISPAKIGAEPAYRCRVHIWSHRLGIVVVNEVGQTIRGATQGAVTRARHAMRRRLQRRRGRLQRAKRSRLRRPSTDSALE